MPRALFLLIFISSASNACANETLTVNNSVTVQSPANAIKGAYPSIQKALDAAKPGDTIFIEGGVYFENVTLNDFGADGKWTTVKAREGAKVVIDGSRTKDAAAFFVKNSKYLTIEGVHFTNAGRYGLAFFDSHHVKAVRCRSSYNEWEGFLSFNSHHSEFIDSIGHDNVHDSFNFNNARDSLMKGCIQYRGGNGLSVEQGSENITIEGNIFYDNWADAILVYTKCKNITLKDNLIYGTHYKNPLDNGQGQCIKITHHNDNVTITGNKIAKCAAAFSYEIAGNGQVTYSGNVLADIGGRIPATPKKAWEGDVLYKGQGDYPGFDQCRWYSLAEIEQKGWGGGNRVDESLIVQMEEKIAELKVLGKITEGKNAGTTNK